MWIDTLNIINYKNIRETTLSFSHKINCFIGDNGMGKTNVLDALYYLSFCKSHSNSIDSQNIHHETDFFLIQGDYVKNNEEEHIYCGMKRKQKKQFKRNKKDYERLSDHIGLIPLVMVSPDDNRLIAEGSEERRKFIDGVISQYNKSYLYDLLHYQHALKQRNALLKLENPIDESIFEIWEEQMYRYGQNIFEEREKFINDFIPVFQEFYEKIAGGKEKISLEYLSQHHRHDDMKERMAMTRDRDKLLGYSTQGIHKDELEMLLDGYPIKRVGSQGQNKSYLISMKFAQFDFLKSTHQCTPLLLLDDIFDKLDTKRVAQIVQLVASDLFGQIFITDTNQKHLDQLLSNLSSEVKIFRVSEGIIE